MMAIVTHHWVKPGKEAATRITGAKEVSFIKVAFVCKTSADMRIFYCLPTSYSHTLVAAISGIAPECNPVATQILEPPAIGENFFVFLRKRGANLRAHEFLRPT